MLDSDLKIDQNELLRYLGYKNQTISDELLDHINDISAFCLKVSKPRYHFYIFPLTENNASLYVGSAALSGNDIKAHLNGASLCAVMAVTLGFDADREFLRLKSHSMTDAVIFDSACTALVEAAADKCEHEIAIAAEKSGYYVNSRYSPGYGDFPLSLQGELLCSINAERTLGITLTDTSLMLPRKSVSAVLGLFKEKPEERAHDCDVCSLRDSCTIRKGGNTCG